MFLRRAIFNVLLGRTADGAAPLPKPLTFTKDDMARETFALAVEAVVFDITQKTEKDIDDEALTALIFKMAAYATKKGWQCPDSLECFHSMTNGIADAVIEIPTALTEPVNLAAMLANHAMRLAQGRAAKQKEPPPVVATTQDGEATLVELVSPAHIVEEGRVMGHYLGKRYDITQLAFDGLKPGKPGSEKYLIDYQFATTHYKRLFSFRVQGKPVATLCYKSPIRTITQIQFNRAEPNIPAPLFERFCEAITLLSQQIPIDTITPAIEHGSIVKIASGAWRPIRTVYPVEIVAGHILLFGRESRHALAAVAAQPGVTLDLSFLKRVDRLPETARASIVSAATAPLTLKLTAAREIRVASSAIKALNLETVTLLEAIEARQASLPVLRRIETLWLEKVDNLDLPSLERARRIITWHAYRFTAPKLEHAELELSQVGTLIAPNLDARSYVGLISSRLPKTCSAATAI